MKETTSNFDLVILDQGFQVDVFPPHAQGIISVVFDDDVIESIYESDPLTGERMFSYHSYTFFPSKYFVTSEQLIRMW